MATGLIIVAVVLIVCLFALCGLYMYLCSKNGLGMFEDPQYKKRIRSLEKSVEELWNSLEKYLFG